MDKLRLCYEQVGRAAWISHLDMMRMLQRAMNRAGIGVKYSEGFNPHAQISILLPLSVGTESRCQLADVKLREELPPDTAAERLNPVLPEGIRVLGAWEDGKKPAELKWMEASGCYVYHNGVPDGAAEKLTALFAREELIVQRRTKRGEGAFDLAPHLRSVSVYVENGEVRLRFLCSINEPVVNPELLTRAVAAYAPELTPDSAVYCREKLFTEKMESFR